MSTRVRRKMLHPNPLRHTFSPPNKHCHTALGQWAVELLQHTSTVPHCLGAVGSGTPLPYTAALPGGSGQWNPAFGQRAVGLLLCTAALPWGSGQWNIIKLEAGFSKLVSTHCFPIGEHV